MLRNLSWKPPSDWIVIETIDLHTGGEPLRVITRGLPEIEGETILAKRRFFRKHLDHIRTGLMWEPRGHADMYGAVITEACTPDGDCGVFFLHNEGYSTMCGHAMLALGVLMLETGVIRKDGERPVLKIDAPPGRITVTARREAGRVREVSFLNVPSFVYLENRHLSVPGIGRVRFDVAYGGAFYAFCDAEELGLRLVPEEHQRLIDYGRRIKGAVIEALPIEHPFEDDLSFLYGTIFTGPARDAAHHSRNVCIFAEGELDRSSTGSGVSARAALHHARGELGRGESITIESILGTTMAVKVAATADYGPHPAVVPEVTGSASITGRHSFWFDPADPLREGFLLRT